MKIKANKIQRYYMDVSSLKSRFDLYNYFINILGKEKVGSFDYEIEGVTFLSVEEGLVDLFLKPDNDFAKRQKLKELSIEFLPEFKLAIKKYFESYF